MPRSKHRTRSIVRMTTIAVAGAVALAGVPAALSFALDAKPTAAVTPVASTASSPASVAAVATATDASPAALRKTRLVGWRSAPKAVRAGRTLHVAVRMDGATRTVRLERAVQHRWHVVDRVRTGHHRKAVLDWRAPAAAGRATLRLHVLPAAGYLPYATGRIVVRVTPAPATPATPAAPTSAAPSTPSSAAPAGGAAGGTTSAAPATGSAADGLRQQLLTLVNQARSTGRTCGGTSYPAAPALKEDAALDRAAADYALKMGTERFFDHSSPDGSTMVSRLAAVGIRNTTERENIAAGQTTAAAVMTGWLQSPGHCANLMARDVTRIGLGHALVSGSPYGHYWVQDFAG